MYVPKPFKVESPEVLRGFIAKYSFATLYSFGEGGPTASHIPLLWEDDGSELGALIGHVARANGQWKDFSSPNELMAVFQGPDGYISPSWYVEKMAVPTWNYQAVHAYGQATVIESKEAVMKLLKTTVGKYEAGFEAPWDIPLPAEFLDKLMLGIVAFSIKLTKVEGKFKLGQNRSEADQKLAIENLRKGGPKQLELAEIMEKAMIIALE